VNAIYIAFSTPIKSNFRGKSIVFYPLSEKLPEEKGGSGPHQVNQTRISVIASKFREFDFSEGGCRKEGENEQRGEESAGIKLAQEK
jgi:hypothetical protein